jgi:hypothetical protein
MSASSPDPFAPPPSQESPGPTKVPWWCSWPLIIVLELACFIPAVVLVWLRPLTTRTTKWIATAILIAIPVVATLLDYGFYPGT